MLVYILWLLNCINMTSKIKSNIHGMHLQPPTVRSANVIMDVYIIDIVCFACVTLYQYKLVPYPPDSPPNSITDTANARKLVAATTHSVAGKKNSQIRTKREKAFVDLLYCFNLFNGYIICLHSYSTFS